VLAVRFHTVGEPSVLRVDEVPDLPAPTGDQLLVGVQASSVNGTDLGLRRGAAPVLTWGRLPVVPGFDLAGEVLACGPEVTAFVPGDRVVALLGHRGGGQAEQVLLRQGRAALAPQHATHAEAAALPLAGLTALQALHGHAGALLAPGRRVLVVGASGGIGSFAVQLARLTGAHVTGTASGPKLGFVDGLGADALVDHRAQPLETLRGQWDVVLDTPSSYGFRRLRHLLTPEGVVVSTRPIAADALRAAVPGRLRADHRRWAAVMTRARSPDLAHLVDLIDRGRLRPSLHRSRPMTDAAAAHREAETTATGKVVLEAPWR